MLMQEPPSKNGIGRKTVISVDPGHSYIMTATRHEVQESDGNVERLTMDTVTHCPKVQQSQMQCRDCGGSGEILKTTDACKSCKGKKTFSTSETIRVEVPRGKPPQSHVRVYNKGNEAAGQETGDFLAVLVYVYIHPLFVITRFTYI
jgi:DnaJ-class molecular chaperone